MSRRDCINPKYKHRYLPRLLIYIVGRSIDFMEGLSQGTEIKEPVTVGQEFIEWAEEYWCLDKLIKIENPDNFNGETCNYNYMRNIFISKINGIIKDRLG